MWVWLDPYPVLLLHACTKCKGSIVQGDEWVGGGEGEVGVWESGVGRQAGNS